MTWEPEDNVANTPEKIAEYFGCIEGNAILKVADCRGLEYCKTFHCTGLASDGERAPNSQMGDRMVMGR